MQTETIALLFISLWVEVLITVLAFQNKSKEISHPKPISNVRIDMVMYDIVLEKLCFDDLQHWGNESTNNDYFLNN